MYAGGLNWSHSLQFTLQYLQCLTYHKDRDYEEPVYRAYMKIVEGDAPVLLQLLQWPSTEQKCWECGALQSFEQPQENAGWT